MPIPDLSTPVAEWLGLTVPQLGTYLLAFFATAPFVMWAKPYVEPALERWRVAAMLTRTSTDDGFVRALAVLWSVALLVPQLIITLTPIFASALELAKKTNRKRPPAVIVLTMALTAGAVLTTTGCGASQSQALHAGLTDTTDLVDPMYAQAVVECDLQEREIIASYPPEQGDAAAVEFAAVRVRCDVALASFEATRGLQLALRATADAMADGRATAVDLIRSLDELAAAVETSRALVDSIRAARRGSP